MSTPHCIRLGREEMDASTLWRAHPPRIRHAGKQTVFEAAGGTERSPKGPLTVSRYAPGDFTFLRAEPRLVLENVEGAFAYPAPPAGTDVWHLNFADKYLFFAYGMAAFAQDEMQVAEHPILGSLLEALEAKAMDGLAPRTCEDARPTPLVVRGAERWCAIDTQPPLAMPDGIYGRRFHRAGPEVLRQAVRRLPPGNLSNILAMSAPVGRGPYSEADLRWILSTAITGFTAAREESAAAAPGARVGVNTGHWGTGAFGGDRVLMALAQGMAARFARIDQLAYHSLDAEGVWAVARANALLEEHFRAPVGVDEAVTRLGQMGFVWGTSDGN
jgi:hypothetical protein